MRASRRRWLWTTLALSVGVFGLGLLSVWGAVAFSDTETTLDDFPTPESARRFVSAHLPAALPEQARITELRYARFTDWHLSATVTLESALAATEYLERARRDATTNAEYCGAQDLGATPRVEYFLSESFACGGVNLGQATGEIRVWCATR